MTAEKTTLLLTLLTLSGGFAISRADTIKGSSIIETDTPGFARIRGDFGTIDTDFPTNGLAGTPAAVSNLLVNWGFTVEHRATGFSLPPAGPAPQGARGVQVGLDGVHRIGPDAADAPNNILPQILSGAVNIPFNGAKNLAVSGTATHLAGTDKHLDHYGIIQHAVADQVATGPRVSGPYVIAAKHVKETTPFRFWEGVALGSTSGAGSTVTFISNGSGGGVLRYNIGSLNVLDRSGGLSNSIIPAFASDPILAGRLTVGDMTLLGSLAGGGFRFGGSQVNLQDPVSRFTFAGQLGNYVAFDTTRVNPANSFALFDLLTVTDVDEVAAGHSAFLREFVNTNFVGDGLADNIFRNLLGIHFGFTTSVNLADLTGDFTHSANVPANFFISAATSSVPEPSTWALTLTSAVALIVLDRRRRRRGKAA